MCDLGGINHSLLAGKFGADLLPKPPPVPKIPKPPVLDPGAAAKKAKEAALIAQMQATGFYGNSDTFKTSGGFAGIGSVGSANLGKTYLGQ